MLFYVIFMGGFVAWVASAWAIHYFYYLPKIRPKKLAITEYPHGTLVVYRWVESDVFWFAPFVISVPILLLLELFTDWGNVEPEGPVLYLFYALALVFLYAQILSWLNSTRLFLDKSGKVTVLHGPLPGIRDPNRMLNSIVDFIPARSRLRFVLFSCGPTFIYFVCAIRADGARVRLLQDIDSEEAAQAIVLALRRRLHRGDAEVTSETRILTHNS